MTEATNERDASPVSEELKPCPCCETDAGLMPHMTVRAVRFWVTCLNDGCGLRTLKFATEAEAIAAWNTRALAQPSAPDVSEAMVEAAAAAIQPKVCHPEHMNKARNIAKAALEAALSSQPAPDAMGEGEEYGVDGKWWGSDNPAPDAPQADATGDLVEALKAARNCISGETFEDVEPLRWDQKYQLLTRIDEALSTRPDEAQIRADALEEARQIAGDTWHQYHEQHSEKPEWALMDEALRLVERRISDLSSTQGGEE